MRIYNGTNSQMNLPFIGEQRLSIKAKSVSENFVGNIDFISMIVKSYETTEVAIVVGGPFELAMCSQVPVATNYIVQSIDEAIERFAVKKQDEKKEEKKVEDVKVEEKPCETCSKETCECEDKECEKKEAACEGEKNEKVEDTDLIPDTEEVKVVKPKRKSKKQE